MGTLRVGRGRDDGETEVRLSSFLRLRAVPTHRTRYLSSGQTAIVDHVRRMAPLAPLHWSNDMLTRTDEQESVADLILHGRRLMVYFFALLLRWTALTTLRLFQEQSQYVPALSLFLKAHHLAEVSSAEPLRLHCIRSLIDCRLFISPTAGEATRSLLELEHVWGEILALAASGDGLLLAQALESRSRAVVLCAAGDGELSSLPCPLLLRPEVSAPLADAQMIQCLPLLQGAFVGTNFTPDVEIERN